VKWVDWRCFFWPGGGLGSVDRGSKPLELVFNSEFLLFQGGDAHLIPIGIGHLALYNVFDFFVLVGQMIDVSLYRHACTSSMEVRSAGALKARA
jgi:hypothetical protein